MKVPLPLKVLCIDDDQIQARLLRAIFAEEQSVTVEAAFDGESGLRAALASSHDVVLLDLHLPDLDGMELLERLKAARPELQVIILTGDTDVKTATEAIRRGAYHFLTKPLVREELVVTVRRAIEQRRLMTELDGLRRKVDARSSLGLLDGPSDAMRTVADQIRRIAATSFTVLVEGATGTGKELVARAVHEESARKGPIMAIDCGAIPENLLESELFGYERGAFTGADRRKEGILQLCDGGTAFLDELGNMPSSIQAKLLRVVQQREVVSLGSTQARRIDVRIVAATNAVLAKEVREGRFRSDLFFRLAEYTIRIPPLRERRDDVMTLAHRFRAEAAVELRRPVTEIAPGAADLLIAYSWPGNVRELRNVVRRAVLVCEGHSIEAETVRQEINKVSSNSIRPVAMPETIEVEIPPTESRSLRDIGMRALAHAERRAIEATLRKVGGNKAEAARVLQTDYKTLYLKIRRYGLESPD